LSDSDANLTVNVSHDPGGATVEAHGDIDSSNCDSLLDAFKALASENPIHHVDVNLFGVSFIDSSGLRALILGQRTVNDAGATFRVSTASHNVRRLLEITGLVEQMGLTGEPRT
jgi:anti-sigma B factor antagonist